MYGFHLDKQMDVEALLEEARRRYLDISLQNAMDLDSLTTILEVKPELLTDS